MAELGRCRVCGLVWVVENGKIGNHYKVNILVKLQKKRGFCHGSGQEAK
jgi:hypothetical protein